MALARGDVIVLDNVLTAHGRNPFTGRRRLYVALGDSGAFPTTDTEAAEVVQ
ncbi:MAG TPA: TauD/TfdA family dioxygenase [Nitrospira sp.]|nr:TauD/TfdA family dioxygenase [Nitrospira sp.]